MASCMKARQSYADRRQAKLKAHIAAARQLRDFARREARSTTNRQLKLALNQHARSLDNEYKYETRQLLMHNICRKEG